MPGQGLNHARHGPVGVTKTATNQAQHLVPLADGDQISQPAHREHDASLHPHGDHVGTPSSESPTEEDISSFPTLFLAALREYRQQEEANFDRHIAEHLPGSASTSQAGADHDQPHYTHARAVVSAASEAAAANINAVTTYATAGSGRTAEPITGHTVRIGRYGPFGPKHPSYEDDDDEDEFAVEPEPAAAVVIASLNSRSTEPFRYRAAVKPVHEMPFGRAPATGAPASWTASASVSSTRESSDLHVAVDPVLMLATRGGTAARAPSVHPSPAQPEHPPVPAGAVAAASTNVGNRAVLTQVNPVRTGWDVNGSEITKRPNERKLDHPVIAHASSVMEVALTNPSGTPSAIITSSSAATPLSPQQVFGTSAFGSYTGRIPVLKLSSSTSSPLTGSTVTSPRAGTIASPRGAAIRASQSTGYADRTDHPRFTHRSNAKTAQHTTGPISPRLAASAAGSSGIGTDWPSSSTGAHSREEGPVTNKRIQGQPLSPRGTSTTALRPLSPTGSVRADKSQAISPLASPRRAEVGIGTLLHGYSSPRRPASPQLISNIAHSKQQMQYQQQQQKVKQRQKQRGKPGDPSAAVPAQGRFQVQTTTGDGPPIGLVSDSMRLQQLAALYEAAHTGDMEEASYSFY